MTATAKRNTAIVSSGLVGLLMAWGVAAGAARQQLVGKEDQIDHAADVATIQSGIRDMREAFRDSLALDHQAHEKQAIRDSAWRADVFRRIDDIACAQNPRRTYCLGR